MNCDNKGDGGNECGCEMEGNKRDAILVLAGRGECKPQGGKQQGMNCHSKNGETENGTVAINQLKWRCEERVVRVIEFTLSK